MYVPKFIGPGVTVRIFEVSLKLMKAGTLFVPYSTTEVIGAHEASKLGSN
jgi:hypothetical protein